MGCRQTRSLWLAVLALMLGAGFAAGALAQDAPPPPALPQNPLPGSAAPQTGAAAAPVATKDLQSCLDETGDYVSRGKAVVYLIGITNKCDRRLKCEIYANVTGPRGTSLGHTVMILGASSSGAAAKKTYAMRVKAAGGTTQVSRDCKVF